MSRRIRLPNRRSTITTDLVVGQHVMKASVGFDQSGAPKEIFLTGVKDGSQLAAILDDTAVAISVALQWGVPARALSASISRSPAIPGAVPTAASLIGAALDLIAEIELEVPRSVT